VARTVVYATKAVPTAGQEGSDPALAPARGPDGFASKIAKYVPAEMISIATLFFAAFHVTGRWVWVWVGLGAALNAFYLWTLSRQPQVPAPPVFFFVLSAVAFVLWSMATIDAVAAAAHLGGDTSQGQRAFMFAFAALIVPALDAGLSALTLRR
jgi:hypothetical protein